MQYTITFKLVFLLVLVVMTAPIQVQAEPAPEIKQAQSLTELLQQIKQVQEKQRQELRAREQRFLQQQAQQKARLAQARVEKLQQEKSLQPMVDELQQMTLEVQQLELRLTEQGQDLRDLQGAFTRIAGEVKGSLQQSLITAQLPQREAELQRLAELEVLPEIADLESLWLLLQEEMTRSSEVNRYQGQYTDVNGQIRDVGLVRVGAFTTFAASGFLQYLPETTELLLPATQPGQRYLSTIQDFKQQPGALNTLIIDPTRGALIRQLGASLSLRERVEQAGLIGVIILVLGALGFLLSLWRISVLGWVSMKVNAQLKHLETPRQDNPLGRVLIKAGQFKAERDENYQFKVDETVLSELPALERGQNFIKLLAAIAPLLGLLGTVTGMILTFQSISLFGNGDPKLMAGGISQALMTTVLGLVVAIPLLFSHSFVVSLSRNLVQRLDEQSAGLLAQRLEGESNHADI